MSGSLTVVGTGILAGGHATLETIAVLRDATKVFYLVADAAAARWILDLQPEAESLYGSYAPGKDRRASYEEMVERMLAAVRAGETVCGAFYGHPGVFAFPTHEAVRRARAEGFEAQMLPGISAEDCLFADLGVDPAAHGCQSFEASDFLLRRRRFDPTAALVLWQIGAIGVRDFSQEDLWSREGLAVLAARLLEVYPPGHEVVIYEAAQYAVCEPLIRRTPLSTLAEAPASVLSTLYVPPHGEPAVDREMRRRLGLDGRGA